MPKVDYSKTEMYKLCCKDPSIPDEYVGATTCRKARKASHKSVCNCKDNRKYNIKVYKFIREHGGFNNWDMVVLEKFPCKDKVESDIRERYWLEKLSATLNGSIPSRTSNEYRQSNREVITKQTKVYRQSNREVIKEKSKVYRQSNREVIKEKSKVYRQSNREVINENARIQYAKCKEKIQCECGTFIAKKGMSTHRKTKKHQKLMNQ